MLSHNKSVLLLVVNFKIGKTYRIRYYPNCKIAEVLYCGAATTGTGQILEKLTIEDYNKSWAEIGANIIVDGAVSYGLGKLPGFKGVTSGRNSWSAVYKSGLTKLKNGTAARMSAKVLAKGIGSSIASGFALDTYYGIKQHAYDRVKNLFY